MATKQPTAAQIRLLGRMFEDGLPTMRELLKSQLAGPRSVKDIDHLLEAMRVVGPWLLEQADIAEKGAEDGAR